MNWLSLHQQSEKFAADAHDAMRRGDRNAAQELFAQAAHAEADALEVITDDKPRTLGITAVSAAALWYKAGELEKAAMLAHRASANSIMPAFAQEQLRELLQVIWNERAQQAAGELFARVLFALLLKFT